MDLGLFLDGDVFPYVWLLVFVRSQELQNQIAYSRICFILAWLEWICEKHLAMSSSIICDLDANALYICLLDSGLLERKCTLPLFPMLYFPFYSSALLPLKWRLADWHHWEMEYHPGNLTNISVGQSTPDRALLLLHQLDEKCCIRSLFLTQEPSLIKITCIFIQHSQRAAGPMRYEAPLELITCGNLDMTNY